MCVMKTEAPKPSGYLVTAGVDWARRRFVEANIGKTKENFYQSYGDLVDVFLARRLEVAQQIQEAGGVKTINNWGRPNGVLCESGLFVPVSEILSRAVLSEEIDPPPGSPTGTRMTRHIVAWFGGGMATSNGQDVMDNADKIDNYALPNEGGVNLIFAPNYTPRHVGITEEIKVTIDGLNDSHIESAKFALIAQSYDLDDQRRSVPGLDLETLGDRSIKPYAESLQLMFMATSLMQQGERIYYDWVPYYEERHSRGTDIRSGEDLIRKVIRFNELLRFVYAQVVGEVRTSDEGVVVDSSPRQISG